MTTNYRQAVEELPADYDTAIDDAMVNVTERGLSEDTDPEAFWQAVYMDVTAG